jgi:glycosyltransferase involved in cell wall biosynthesis/hydroxymethylpyrimidine pyrophosphatase-like HAD family hydrolase
MKIYYASQSFYPHIGGVSTYLYNLCNKMVARGNNVVEVHLRSAGEDYEDDFKGIKIFRVPRDPINKEIMKKYGEFKETIYKACHYQTEENKKIEEIEGYKEYIKVNEYFGEELRNLLKQDPADVVHIHDFQLLFAYKYVPRGTPLVLTWHIPFIKSMSDYLKEFLIKHMREFDKVVFSSPEYIEEVINAGLPKEKIELIYPIANTELFKKKNIDREEIRKEYNLPQKDKIILSVQRIDPKSGHEQLIKAMPNILKKIPDTKLVFVGGTSLSNKLSDSREKIRQEVLKLINELKLKENIIFTGSIDYHKLPEVYNSVDVVALCSKNEGFGLSITEGMACGRAVVGTNVGGIPLQIKNNENGYVMDVNDIEETSNAIIKILENQEEREAMEQKSLEIVDKNFKIDVGVQKHIALYTSIIKSKSDFKGLEFYDADDITAIATDLDRTLTDGPVKEEFDINDFDQEVFQQLSKIKIEKILISGRSLKFIKELAKNFPIWKCIIAENGCILYFPETKKEIIIDTKQMKQAREIIKDLNLTSTAIRDIIVSTKIKNEEEIRNKLGPLCSELNFIYNVDELMILPYEITKGFALKLAHVFLNLEPEKTIIVGDGENDIDMYLNPGIKIALKNSIPKLKQLSMQVIDKPSTEGMKKIIDIINQKNIK